MQTRCHGDMRPRIFTNFHCQPYWISVKGWADTFYADILCIHTSTKHMWAPSLISRSLLFLLSVCIHNNARERRAGPPLIHSTQTYCVFIHPQSTCELLASFPGLPRFYLLFVFTIIHGSRGPVLHSCVLLWTQMGGKNWRGLGTRQVSPCS